MAELGTFSEKRRDLMVDFLKVRRRISYRERMLKLLDIVNKSETREVSIRELVKKWQLSPNYVRRIMRWCSENYSHVAYDENYGVLFLRTEASPTYRATKAQTTLAVERSHSP